MLESFVVPIDATVTSEFVLPYVRTLAKKLGSPVHLVSVVADDAGAHRTHGPHGAALSELYAKQHANIERHLAELRAQLESEGISATTEVTAGKVAEEIVASAQAHNAGCVAMATHGRVGPERWFLGSVAERVVRTSTFPVLLIRPTDSSHAPRTEINHIVLSLDGSKLAEAALPYATFLAKSFNVRTTIVRTLEMTWLAPGSDMSIPDGGLSPELLETLESDAKQYLQETSARIKAEGIEVDTSFSFRDAAGAITDLAHGVPGSLVAMGTHGRSGIERTFLGSVADRVIRSSEAPVLVIRGAD